LEIALANLRISVIRGGYVISAPSQHCQSATKLPCNLSVVSPTLYSSDVYGN
jgi:hypothetical protein